MISWPRAEVGHAATTRLPIVPEATNSAGLLAEQLRGALLERVDGRVVAEDVVADLGRGHRAAHLVGGLRDGVGAEVDQGHAPSIGGGRRSDVRTIERSASGYPPPSPQRTRGVAAQHASLSRWRSPVRIRSGPPSLRIFLRPVRPPGRGVPLVRWLSQSAPRETPPRPSPSSLGLVALAIAVRASRGGAARLRPRRRVAAPPVGERRRRPRRRRVARDRARRARDAGRDRDSPAASRAARRRRDADARSVADVAIVPVTQFRTTRTDDDRERGRGRPRRDEQDATRRSSSSRPTPTRSSPRSAPSGPPTRRHLVLAKDAATLATDLAKNRKRLGVPPRRRRSGRASGRSPGATGRCSASTAVESARRLAADRAARGRRRGTRPSTRPRPGRSSPAATSCSTAASPRRSRSRSKGVDFPFDGGTAEITGRYVLLGVRLGPAAARSGPATGRVRDLIKGADLAIANFENPAPNTFRYHTVGDRLLGRPGADRGPRERRHRLRRRSPTTTSATPAGTGSSRRSRTSTDVRHQVGRRRQGRAGRPQAGDPRGERGQGRDPRLRHDRAATTAAGTSKPAARSLTREERQGGRRRRPATPAPRS